MENISDIEMGFATMSSVYATTSNTTITTSQSGNGSKMPRSCPKADLPPRLLRAYYTDIVVLSLVFAVALVGNFCVLFAVWRRRKKRTRMHLFMAHLAVADIIVAFFEVFPELMMRLTCEFLLGDAVCRIVKYLQIVGMYGSTYVLVSTAMDRYNAIRYPMLTFKQSKKRVHITISLAWVLSLLLSIPQLVFWGLVVYPEYGRHCDLYNLSRPTGVRVYVTWYFVSVLLFPVIMLSFFYGMIAWTIFKNLKNKKLAAANNRTRISPGQANFAPRASNVKNVARAKLKTVKMTFVVVFVYAVCYIPFFTVKLLQTWGLTNESDLTNQVLQLLASLNSCVNPWVYMGFSGHLLGELKPTCLRKKQSQEAQPLRSFRNTTVTNLGNSSMYGETSHQQAFDV